jgi:hypothetical protein
MANPSSSHATMNDVHQPLLLFVQVEPFFKQTTWGAQNQPFS